MPDPTPPAPTLDEAERALDAGDFGAARRIARAGSTAPDEDRRSAARAMLARLAPDPLVGLLYLAALAFFAYAVLHFARG